MNLRFQCATTVGSVGGIGLFARTAQGSPLLEGLERRPDHGSRLGSEPAVEPEGPLDIGPVSQLAMAVKVLVKLQLGAGGRPDPSASPPELNELLQLRRQQKLPLGLLVESRRRGDLLNLRLRQLAFQRGMTFRV